MAIAETFQFMPLDMPDDPDDYRPESKLAFVIDPGDPKNGKVENMTIFREQIAPGDQIPLHVHTTEEILLLEQGELKVILGEQEQHIKPGSVVFIPSKVAHSFKNTGQDIAKIFAVFPSGVIDIKYLERNPYPGTEGQSISDPVSIHIRKFLDGNSSEAIKPMDPDAYNP